MLSQTYKYNAISKNRFQCCFSPGIWGETDEKIRLNAVVLSQISSVTNYVLNLILVTIDAKSLHNRAPTKICLVSS